MSEQPEIIIDHRPYNNQEKTVLEPFDFDDLPKQVKLSIHRMKCLDDVVREFRRPPPQYVNVWVKLEYGDPVPLLFDMEGHPYIMASAKKKPGVEVKVLIKEKQAGKILDHLETATDFCDYCKAPLEKHCSHWLEEDGDSIADVYICAFCEGESIRWDPEFLEHHPVLGELTTR